MLNLTAVNLTEPILPENPLTYFEEYNNKVLLWMAPLLVFTVWVNIYTFFNIILYFVKMYNDCVEKKNLTEPILPENPLTYFEEYNNKVLLWMAPLLVFTVWVNIYTFFNIILYFVKMYNDCVEKKNKTVCKGEVKCKEGCENFVGKIFLETYT